MRIKWLNNGIEFFCRYVIVLLVFGFFSLCAQSQVYFNAKVAGPSANVFSISEDKTLEKITDDGVWRDKEFSVSKKGDVAFSSNRKDTFKMDLHKKRDDYNIFLMEVSGESITQVTFGPQRDFLPKFDPSGEKIAYLRFENKNIVELHLYNREKNSDMVLVGGKNIFDFDWSPNGKRIAFSSAQKSKASISILDVDSLIFNDLVLSSLGQGILKEKSNGDDILFSNEYLLSPVWSPNGEKIAFITHPLERSKTKFLYVMDSNGKNKKRLSEEGQQVQSPVSWNGSGESMVYSALVGYEFYYDERLRDKVYKGAMHVFKSNLKGRSSQLTQGDHFHGRPVYSPNGKHVAYLFADKLGGALTYSLKTMNPDGAAGKEVYSRVDKESMLYWR